MKMNVSFETIMAFVSAVVAPFVAFIFKEVSAVKRDLADFKKEAAEKYASREEFIRLEDKIDNLTQLIIDRLPKKGK